MKKIISILSAVLLPFVSGGLEYTSAMGYSLLPDGSVDPNNPNNVDAFLRRVDEKAVTNKWSNNYKELKAIADNTHVPLFVLGGNRNCPRFRDFVLHQILTKEFLEIANEHNDMLLCVLTSRYSAGLGAFLGRVNTQTYTHRMTDENGNVETNEGVSWGCPRAFLYVNGNLTSKIRFCIESSILQKNGGFSTIDNTSVFVWHPDYISVFAVQLQNFFAYENYNKFPEFLHAHLDHVAKPADMQSYAVWEENTIATVTVKKRDQEKMQSIDEFAGSLDSRNPLLSLTFVEITPSWFLDHDHRLTSFTVAESGEERPTLELTTVTNGTLKLKGSRFNENPIDVVMYNEFTNMVVVTTNILAESETPQGLKTNLFFVTSNDVDVILKDKIQKKSFMRGEVKVEMVKGGKIRIISDAASIDEMEFVPVESQQEGTPR